MIVPRIQAGDEETLPDLAIQRFDQDSVHPEMANLVEIKAREKFRPVQLGHRMGAISYRNRYRNRYRDRILCFRKAALTLP
jgi:hypothetical protein